MTEPIFCIGRIGGVLTIQTRRWLWKPGQPMVARRNRSGPLRLLYYRDHRGRRALRLSEHKWLSRKGVHGDIRPA